MLLLWHETKRSGTVRAVTGAPSPPKPRGIAEARDQEKYVDLCGLHSIALRRATIVEMVTAQEIGKAGPRMRFKLHVQACLTLKPSEVFR
jgi:hypothetical protein